MSSYIRKYENVNVLYKPETSVLEIVNEDGEQMSLFYVIGED